MGSKAKENWKDVVGFEGLYVVSNLGRIKSVARKGTRGVVMKPDFSNAKHYAHINLTKHGVGKKFSVHRIVAKAWIPNPENKPQVNHIDGNKKNNAVSNLEWVTGKENIRHAIDNGLQNLKKLHDSNKRKVHQIKNGKIVATFESVAEAEKMTGVFNQNIIKVCQKERHTVGNYSWQYATKGAE